MAPVRHDADDPDSLSRLPIELVSKILVLTLPYCRRGEVGPTPWNLGQIDAATRQAAIATKALWSHIALNFDFDVDDACKRWISTQASEGMATALRDAYLGYRRQWVEDMLVTQLERAKNEGLHIRVQGRICVAGRDHTGMGWMDCTRMLHLLAHHCEQWEEATFAIAFKLWSCLQGIKGKIPRLRYLGLTVISDGRVWDGVEGGRPEPRWDMADVAGIFETASSLRHLGLVARAEFDGRQPFNLPLTNLTSITGPWSLHLHNGLLPHCENLEELCLAETSSWEPVHLAAEVTLPNLRYLCVPQQSILAKLTCPALEELVLGEESIDRGPTRLVSFVRKSGTPPITKAVLLGVHWGSPRLLDCMPAMRTLVVALKDADEDAFEMLGRAPALGRQAENLTILLDEGSRGDFHCAQELLDMIDSRMGEKEEDVGAATLRSLTITGLRMDDPLAAGLREREKRGLEVNLLDMGGVLKNTVQRSLQDGMRGCRLGLCPGWEAGRWCRCCNASVVLDYLRGV